MRGIDLNVRDFHGVDLNLLVAFDALMAERSVVRAAERVFLGQPAMSHALGRLRELLNDPLFVRTGNRMEPTVYAKELAPKVHAWLTEASRFLQSPDSFDPARAQAEIRIGIPDGLEAILLPPLVAKLAEEAPGVVLHARPVATDRVLRALDQEELELAVGPSSESPRDWHDRVLLATSRFDCLYSPRHLSIPKPPSLPMLAELNHVAYSYRGDLIGVIDGFFEARGLKRRIAVISASLIAVGRIMEGAPLVSIQPSIYAPLYTGMVGFDGGRLALVPVDDDDMRLEISMVWHRRHDGNALHAYVRRLIQRMMSR